MLRFLPLFALVRAHDTVHIPPVEVNIRSLGAMQGEDVPLVDLWLAYSLRPLEEICKDDYIGTIRQSLIDTDLNSHWRLQ